MVELLNRINSAKQGNEQIVVCGLNTGAIVARYALSWMEANSMSHNTRLFASIDAPNKGLNVPPSFQFLVKKLGLTPAPQIFASLFGIDGKMYKQLVYNSTNGSGLWQGRSFEFIAFFNEFNSLNGNGFPKLCKNIAISNGAKLPNIYNGIGTGGPELALSYDFRVPNNIIFGSSNPNGTSSIQGGLAYSFSKQIQGSLPPTTILFMGAQNIGFIQQTFNIPFIENDGIDICPGASTDIFFKEFDNYVKSLQTTYAQETHEFGGTLSKFTMVPTSSALGISDDWFTNISNNLTISCSIPFDAYYAPINRNNDILTNSTIGSNWLYDQIMVTNNLIEITSATPFNFGENTSDIIFNDLTVKNQGSLYINGNYATDNISRNSSFSNPQTATKENSTFTVYTSCKKNSKNNN